MENQQKITVKTSVNAPIEKVWELWTGPAHIMKWNNASPDWHSPRVENDLRTGGKFLARMEAKDGSMGFDFEGTYFEIIPQKQIGYSLGDERKVEVFFSTNGNSVEIEEIFDAEKQNPVEMQQSGWQAILNNFKAYAEQQ